MARRAEEQPKHLGRFTAGMTGLAVAIIFARTGGGYLDCSGAAASGIGQRWDPRKLTSVGPITIAGDLTPVDPARGRFLWDWLTTDVGSVPTETGIYVLTVDLIFPNGQETLSQQAVFEVTAKPRGL